MKKFLISTLLVAMIVTTTACGNNNSAPVSESGSSIANSESIPQNEDSSSNQETEKTRLYGKVVSVVGNELELNIGTPEEDIVKILEEEQKKFEQELENNQNDKDSIGAVPAVPMTPAMGGGDGFVTGGEVETNDPIVPMTYGEEKTDVIIPVGIPYNDLLSQGRISFEKIKEGNVLCIEIDGDTVIGVYFLS